MQATVQAMLQATVQPYGSGHVTGHGAGYVTGHATGHDTGHGAGHVTVSQPLLSAMGSARPASRCVEYAARGLQAVG